MTNTPMTLMDFIKAAKAEISEIDGAQLDALRKEKSDVLLLDVREAAEYDQGHLDGALLVPRGVLETAADFSYPKRFQALVDAREHPVVLYCASGGRSAMAAATLKRMGFNDVYSLAGGVMQWAKEQRPLVR